MLPNTVMNINDSSSHRIKGPRDSIYIKFQIRSSHAHLGQWMSAKWTCMGGNWVLASLQLTRIPSVSFIANIRFTYALIILEARSRGEKTSQGSCLILEKSTFELDGLWIYIV